jgi:putative hydrolase of the HAD superfamily
VKVNNKTVWVFDLDDTLYSERAYQTSGFHFLAREIERLYQIKVADNVSDAIESNSDALQVICDTANLPSDVKSSLLWMYRLHNPSISPYLGVKEVLNLLQSHSLGLAIITDGRSVTQRLKLKALGLEHIEVLISEEWEETKPGRARFEYIEQKYASAERFVYVGDNIKKDFITPNQMGWLTIGLLDDGQNIHPQNLDRVGDEYLPYNWISNVFELKSFI